MAVKLLFPGPTVSVAIDTLRPQLNIFGAWKERELMFTRVCSATQAYSHFAIALVLVNMFPLGISTLQVLFPSAWRRTAGVYKDETYCWGFINSNDHIT